MIIWKGYDGSSIIGHRAFKHYLTARGKAVEKINDLIERRPMNNLGLILWGVGSHGGGPSRIDLENINELKESLDGCEIIHSIPENYFQELKEKGDTLSEYTKDINPWAVGCYTSQIRIKQKHRLLENELDMTEKMLSSAALQKELSYPANVIHEALCNLMTSEFHDILLGSSIEPVEEASLRLLDHGIEIISRLNARAFFSLASGRNKALDGEIPILIYNPHPYKVNGIFECEFQIAD